MHRCGLPIQFRMILIMMRARDCTLCVLSLFSSTFYTTVHCSSVCPCWYLDNSFSSSDAFPQINLCDSILAKSFRICNNLFYISKHSTQSTWWNYLYKIMSNFSHQTNFQIGLKKNKNLSSYIIWSLKTFF